MDKYATYKLAAEKACFYVSPAGIWYRMSYVEDDHFMVMDEDSGESYRFDFTELEDNPHFEMLVRVRLS